MNRRDPFDASFRPRPLVYGHRGCIEAPENTLAAFSAAADAGADGIELDVRIALGGDVVCSHDPTLARVTGGSDTRAVALVPWRELAAVANVPLLSQALELARARRLRVNVELKRDVPSRAAVVRATARLLRAMDPRLPVIVSSFDPAMLAGFALEAPAIPRALLVSTDGWYPRLAGLAGPLGSTAIHLPRTMTEPKRIARAKERGLLVNVWTVNDTGEARDLAELGVDGLITDKPAEILAAFAR